MKTEQVDALLLCLDRTDRTLGALYSHIIQEMHRRSMIASEQRKPERVQRGGLAVGSGAGAGPRVVDGL